MPIRMVSQVIKSLYGCVHMTVQSEQAQEAAEMSYNTVVPHYQRFLTVVIVHALEAGAIYGVQRHGCVGGDLIIPLAD